jgi:hypothetical protein
VDGVERPDVRVVVEGRRRCEDGAIHDDEVDPVEQMDSCRDPLVVDHWIHDETALAVVAGSADDSDDFGQCELAADHRRGAIGEE